MPNSVSHKHRMTRFVSTAGLILGSIGVGAIGMNYLANWGKETPKVEVTSSETKVEEVVSTPGAIHFPKESWESVNLKFEGLQKSELRKTITLTGKIGLNEDHVAHIYPLVDGRVEEVKVQFGDRVKKDQLLVVIQSKEVGQAKMELFQDRLHRDFVVQKDKWTDEILANTSTLISSIQENVSIENIEQSFKNRPMGEFRDKLLSAYVSLYKSNKDCERLAPLSESGATGAKQLMEAETNRNVDRVKLQSWVEQITQDSRQATLVSKQAVKEAETKVSVDETNLKILGFNDDELKEIDPAKQGEAISHYPIVSPFDGTIISKDVVLLERVGPTSQILSIADLSTVWVKTDCFEEHLPLLTQLKDKTIIVRSSAWPEKSFEAKVFYTGDIVEEATRTVAMRAEAKNDEGLLKPGMFVSVELPEGEATQVLQVDEAAVFDHEGQPFVFVHVGDDLFERRDIKSGRRSKGHIEVLDGLREGDEIVIQGGFALKSKLLASLLSEE